MPTIHRLECRFLSVDNLVRGLGFFTWNHPPSSVGIPSLWALDLGDHERGRKAGESVRTERCLETGRM